MKRMISAILLTTIFSLVAPVTHAGTVICWPQGCVDISDVGVHP